MAKKKKQKNGTVRNAHGILINVGCMSCRHRKIIQGIRLCCLTEKEVESDSVCDQWQLSEGLKNAGLGSGVVRRRGTKEVLM